jgi:hypothetical protein
MDHRTLFIETLTMKTILKFDTGADGFKKMMIVLAAVAVVVLLFGVYFLNLIHQELQTIS